MYEAVNIAATGIKQQQRRLDTIANNVANINSNAYKSARLDFKDALYTNEFNTSYPRTPEPDGNQRKGHGVMIAAITRDFRTGSVQSTGRDLDVMIEGEGFFELEDPNGNIVYTRNGSFEIGEGADGGYLVTGDGWYLHDENGNRIQVPYGIVSIDIEKDGIIRFRFPDSAENAGADEEAGAAEAGTGAGTAAAGTEAAGTETETAEALEITVKLGIYTFRNITGLESFGNGNYIESAASGAKRPADNFKIWQGDLEISNVNLSEEMTRIIRTQRVFQLASRALTTADDMEGIANNMRR